jgi:hypothetical protein
MDRLDELNIFLAIYEAGSLDAAMWHPSFQPFSTTTPMYESS